MKCGTSASATAILTPPRREAAAKLPRRTPDASHGPAEASFPILSAARFEEESEDVKRRENILTYLQEKCCPSAYSKNIEELDSKEVNGAICTRPNLPLGKEKQILQECNTTRSIFLSN